MHDNTADMRLARLHDAPGAPWLAERMKATVARDFCGNRPVVEARYLGDLAEALGDVVNLAGGTIEDMLPPDFVREAAREAVEGWPHYPGVKGHHDLRRAIAAKLSRENGIAADPENEIIPTIGLQQVIDSVMRILVDPGDEVVLLDPEYASLAPTVDMAGGRIRRVPLACRDGEWRLDLDVLARAVSRNAKLLAFSNPNNPTGIVFTSEELEAIAELAQRHDFWVFCDEEYEKTLFDGVRHTSLASLPGMKERTITGYSFSKPYAMTAYRIGWMVGPAAVLDHMHTIVRASIQACPAVGLRAAHAVLTGDMRPWLEEKIRLLDSKRRYLVDRLNAMPGIRCNMPAGVYFVFPRIDLGLSSFAFAERVLREGRVAVSPGSQFGPNGEGHVRISFCPSMDTIRTGLDRLEQVVAGLTR
jgi:aminotransferase